MSKYASVYTLDGNELAVGLQTCDVCDEAIQAAERHADDLGTDVLLFDGDGEWMVHPMVDGEREAADPIDPIDPIDLSQGNVSHRWWQAAAAATEE